MDYKIIDGVPYEIEIVSLAHGDDVAVELTDMSPDGRALAEIRVSSTQVSLVHQRPMPVEVYAWWTEAVVATARALTGTDDS